MENESLNTVPNTPIPLIQFKGDNFEITPEAIEFLQNIKGPMGVITIVGKYRTGKSLFLNKVLLNNNNSFKVCPTINSCTKGLWISRQVIKSECPDSEDMDVIVIDSEGFGAMEETEAYNNRILLFALLLSSYFIYNSVGTIDEKSLNNLNVITNLAKELQSKNLANDKIEDEFPTFMWVVRDFTLKLVSNDGDSIDSKQYLEYALEIQKGVSDAVENKNKIRRMIKHFFRERDCFTLVTPVEKDSDLQKLNSLPDSEIRPEFLHQITVLRDKIIRKVKPKKLKHKKLTGETFIELAKSYIEAINSGSLPNIDSAWKSINNFEISQWVSRAKEMITEKLGKFIEIGRSEESFTEMEKELLVESLAFIKKKISNEENLDSVSVAIKSIIETNIKVYKQANAKKSLNFLLNNFHEKYEEFGYDENVDGFESKWAKLEKNYKEEYASNPSLQEFLLEHLNPLKFESLLSLMRRQNDVIKSEQSEKSVLKESLEKRLKEAQELSKSLENTIYDNELQITIIKAKSDEQQKIKTIEFSYLQKELNETQQHLHKYEIKNEDLEREIKEKESEIGELRIRLNSLGTELRQSDDDRGYSKKELEILRDNLDSKTKEIEELKSFNADLKFQLQKFEEKQSYIIAKTNNELHEKTTNYNNLVDKYEQAQNEIAEKTQKINKLQHLLETEQVKISKEEKIYEAMFQTLKGNFESERQHSFELTEANKNMAFALKSLEQRFEQMEQNLRKLKEFKRCFKNSSCMQCHNCTKFFVPAIFPQHLNICIVGNENLKKIENEKQKFTIPRVEISVKQTLLKDSDSKPYTEYVLEIKKEEKVWTINRKYKEFCDLHSQLKIILPGVPLSESSFIVNPQENTKKSLLVEERRKILERYLNDVALNPYISQEAIWREFIEDVTFDPLHEHQNKLPISEILRSGNGKIKYEGNENINENYAECEDKENEESLGKQYQKTPEEFLKIWNERNLRAKEVSKVKKNRF